LREQLGKSGLDVPSPHQLRLFPRVANIYDRKLPISEATKHTQLETGIRTAESELTKGHRERMQQELERLEREWNTRNVKITRMRQGLAIEANVANKFQLEQQILTEETELAQLGAKMREIELLLESSQ
jgi:hypothetical protein